MSSRRFASPGATWLAWGVPLQTGWEFLHSPLYADHTEGALHVLWTGLHGTVGDAGFLLVSFWITAAVM